VYTGKRHQNFHIFQYCISLMISSRFQLIIHSINDKEQRIRFCEKIRLISVLYIIIGIAIKTAVNNIYVPYLK